MEDNYFEVEEPTPLLPEPQQAGDLPQSVLEPEGPRAPTRRKRRTQIGLVLVAAVVVVVMFRGLIAPAAPTTGVSTPQPTPSPPTILLSSNINFGTVTINGRRQRGTIPMFLMPRDGNYSITINAPPFQPKTCMFGFAGGEPTSDYSTVDCGVGTGNFPTMTANGITAAPSAWLEITFTANDLPPDQQRQINALLAQSVIAQASTTVSAGSYIATRLNADNTVTSRRVSTRLQATAYMDASTNFGLSRFNCNGLICPFGIVPQDYPAYTGMVWSIAVPVALRWHFATPGGQVLGDVSFPVANLKPVLLSYTPGAGWSMSPELISGPLNVGEDLGDLDCSTGVLLLHQQLQATNFSASTSSGQGIEGCQIVVQDAGGSDRGSFIWRFGVLLAADAPAHKLLPRLPIAPAAEIAAVQGHI